MQRSSKLVLANVLKILIFKKIHDNDDRSKYCLPILFCDLKEAAICMHKPKHALRNGGLCFIVWL